MRYLFGFATCLLMVALFGAAQNPPTQPAGDRWFSDVAGDDHSAALQKILDAGPGVVRIGRGTFQIHDVTIPANVTLIGSGPATILKASQGRPVFRQENVAQWQLRDVAVEGEATGKWEERNDQIQHGIIVARSGGYEISSVTIRNFNGAGLQISSTSSGFSGAGQLSQITAHDNFIGIRFDTRAEYITATQLDCHHNLAGVVIHAGNTNIANSNIGNNLDGIVIEDHENGSHGSLTGCLVNHNARNALWCKNVEHGMAITNCCFFYGTIKLDNSRGVTISSGLLSCNIATEGDDANRIAGNHVIPLTFAFQFAPKTQVAGNFTKEGDWERNR